MITTALDSIFTLSTVSISTYFSYKNTVNWHFFFVYRKFYHPGCIRHFVLYFLVRLTHISEQTVLMASNTKPVTVLHIMQSSGTGLPKIGIMSEYRQGKEYRFRSMQSPSVPSQTVPWSHTKYYGIWRASSTRGMWCFSTLKFALHSASLWLSKLNGG